jgi:hypothetical protein
MYDVHTKPSSPQITGQLLSLVLMTICSKQEWPSQLCTPFFWRRTGVKVWTSSIQHLNCGKLHTHFLFGDISCVWTQFVLLVALKLSRTDTSEAKLKCFKKKKKVKYKTILFLILAHLAET